MAGCQRGKSHLAGRPCKYKLHYSICNTTKSNNKTKPMRHFKVKLLKVRKKTKR